MGTGARRQSVPSENKDAVSSSASPLFIMKRSVNYLITFGVLLVASPVFVSILTDSDNPAEKQAPKPPVVDCDSADRALTECAVEFGEWGNSLGSRKSKYSMDEWDAKYHAWCYEEFELCNKYCGADKC